MCGRSDISMGWYGSNSMVDRSGICSYRNWSNVSQSGEVTSDVAQSLSTCIRLAEEFHAGKNLDFSPASVVDERPSHNACESYNVTENVTRQSLLDSFK